MSSRATVKNLIGLCLYLTTLSTAYGAISLTWGTPTSGTAYITGATISYSGNVSWAAGDPQCTNVQVSLSWWDGFNDESAAVTDSGFATMGDITGTERDFSGSLTATRYLTQVSYYYLTGIPLKKGIPYSVDGVPYEIYQPLGTIVD